MELNQIESCVGVSSGSSSNAVSQACISLQAEIPEVLYRGLKDLIGANPKWDQYSVMSSALANFLFQNGCEERAVIERYLSDLFSRSNA